MAQTQDKIVDGKCPLCSKELDYGNQETQDHYIWYDVDCSYCGFIGKQWDKVMFTGYTVYDDDGNVVKEYNVPS